MNVFASNWTKFPNEEIHIRYYFDGESKPRIDMTIAEFFGKGGKHPPPFTLPLDCFDQRGSQSLGCWRRCSCRHCRERNKRPTPWLA